MKAKDLREMAKTDIKTKVGELQEELFNLRFQARIGQLGNPLRMRMARKEIARAQTVITEQNRSGAK